MSRTYRKKTIQRADISLDHKWIGRRFIKLDEKGRMRELHKHFGDQHSGKRNAPKWFRKQLNVTVKANEKQALYYASRETENVVVFPVRKRNVNCEWY